MKRLLIANRGEIALRILRACHELGIEVVAAYTKADRALAHLKWANRTICIGAHSYLDGAQFVAAAQTTGCDAIHPGYGFLSENASFAQMIEAAALTFVGPTAKHIEQMGDKAIARNLLSAAGLPVLPGSDGAAANVDEAVSCAERIGYPVMLKASHGGGGRGIMVVHSAAALSDAWAVVSAQAEVLFGKTGVYVEKYLTDARHIEVQIFGDGHGRVLHFGARECSIQRRHQKLIEESPPPGISAAAIDTLATRCCEALAAIAYRNAGTLEFLYSNGNFYFIEMNTRIQVEHPVTESVTGVDLVKLQLALAATGKLELVQSDIAITGHAIECRINAEDESFVPAPGQVARLNLPGGPGVRVDTHLYQGYDVPHQYDSLLAKLITSGRDREEAVHRMTRALKEFELMPLTNNIGLHQQILGQAKFVDGEVTTNFIEEMCGH